MVKKKIRKSLVTLESLDAKLDRVIDAMVTRQEFDTLTNRVQAIEQTLHQVLLSIDKLAKSVDDLLLEYASIKVQLDRHERWFKEIAKKTGVELRP